MARAVAERRHLSDSDVQDLANTASADAPVSDWNAKLLTTLAKAARDMPEEMQRKGSG